MIQELWSLIEAALGLSLGPQELNAGQMMLRGFIVFVLAIAMIRIGDKRFMGSHTALDVMLGIVFGSVVGRAITGNSAFFPTLAAGFALIVFHWILSAIAFRSARFGALLKGKQRMLVKNGEILWKEMRRGHISEQDLHEAMQNSGHSPDAGQIECARLQRNGEISIIFKTR